MEKVDTTLIEQLLNDGFIPVIAAVGMDENGIAYNINADTAAAAIAIALHAEKFVSMTDIVGLLYDKDDESTLIPEVEISEIEGYKAHGVISGGMIPKIEGMADAIYEGVHEAVIIDGRVPHSVLLEMFSDRGSGTLFYRRGNRGFNFTGIYGGFCTFFEKKVPKKLPIYYNIRIVQAGRGYIACTYGTVIHSPIF